MTFLSCSQKWIPIVCSATAIVVVFHRPHLPLYGHVLVSWVSPYRVRVLPLMLWRPLRMARERMARDGENSWESMRGGVWGICSPTGHRVISRDAIMASLHQNRKHYEIGLFTPTRARLTAESTLAPFSHPHILWTRALSAARRLCPHRRCHKTPSMPPISTQPQPLWS